MSTEKTQVAIRAVARDKQGRILLIETAHGHVLSARHASELARSNVEFYVGTTEVQVVRSKGKKGWNLRTRANGEPADNLDGLGSIEL